MRDRSRLIFDIAINVLEVLLNLLLEVMLFPFGGNKRLGHLRIRPYTDDGRYIYFGDKPSQETIDSRIAKIDSARTSLSEALSAMDELKDRAEKNRRDLEFLRYQIQRAETHRKGVSGELEVLTEMAALDSEAVRRALKLPTRVSIWTERVIAFLFGVVSSTVASYIYEYFVKPHL
jgi:hypothetical protein